MHWVEALPRPGKSYDVVLVSIRQLEPRNPVEW